MRFFQALAGRVLIRITQFLLGPEDKRFQPPDFLVKILREYPNALYVRVVGPNQIAEFYYYTPPGDGTTHSTVWFPEDGLMPSIYHALLKDAAENGGIVKEPFGVLSANHRALSAYLGSFRTQEVLGGLQRVRTEQPTLEA